MKNLQYITMPFKLDGFMELDDASFGKGIKDVYRRVHEQERQPLESEGARCLSNHCWSEIQRGMDKAEDLSQKNSVKGHISAEKRKEKKESTAVNSSQPQSTAVNHSQPNQPTSTESTDKIIKEKNKENTSIAQTEFALEGGSCSEKPKKTDFDLFMELYGKGDDDIENCRKQWKRIPKDCRKIILERVPIWVQNHPVEQYRCSPAKYLREKKWNELKSIQLAQPQAQNGQLSSGKSFEDEIKDGNA